MPSLILLCSVLLNNMENLVPIEGYVLVELSNEFAIIETPDKPYSTRTSGTVVKISDDNDNFYLGKRVFFEEYKDGISAGENLAFIKTKYIAGYQVE